MSWWLLMVFFMSCGLCLVNSVDSDRGANYNNSNTKTSYTKKEKALFVADALVTHDHIFRQLEEIFYALGDLKSGLPPSNSSMGPILADLVLSRLPYLLRNSDFKASFGIILDEIGRVDTSNVQKLAMANHWAPNNTNVTNYLLYSYEHGLNYIRMIRRILARKSARDYFPYDKTLMPNTQCYDDTMDFMDSLVGGRYGTSGPEELNFTSFMWAIQMFDAIGKPSGGITKGALYYIGSYDQCNSIKAHIPANIYLGNVFRKEERSYTTKFCRAEFNVSDSFVQSMNVDTRGLILKLNWGVCVPASCHSEDISRLFSMGPVKLPVNRVACLQKPDLEKDTSAIVAICILCVFGILVALATFSEGVMGALPVSKREEQNYFGRINNEFVSDEKFIIKNGYAPDAFELKQTASLSTGWYTTLSETNGYEKIDKSKGDIGESSSSKTDSYTRNVPAPDEHPYEKLSNGDGKSLSHNPKVSVEISNTELEAKVNDIGVKVENVADKEAVRKIHPIIKAFSLITNMPKILNGKKSKGAINCVHGIRFVSMLWIILGHTYNYGVVSQSDSQTTQNLIDADGLFKRFSFQGIMAAGFAVDTFFLLSGFLVSYLTLKDLRKRKITGGYMFMYYFHRFWRLTPLYMIVLMTFSCLYKYMGDGPLWPAAIKAADYCKTNWWTNVLYVNNLVNNHEQCLGWSWYLANDMQFYIISPIFIFTIFWYAPVGIALAVLVGAAGVSSAFYEEYVTGGDMFTMNQIPDYWQNVYTVPWTRIAAYLVGIIFGWIMVKYDKLKTLSFKNAVVGWIITLGVGIFISYITYTYRKEDAEAWPKWVLSLYESTTRPIFAACVAWVIFACHHNRGGFINSVLSWNGIIPLSRLTYACYLVHPTCMMLKIYSKRNLIYISDFDVAYLYMGHTCMTFMIAFIFSVTFEAPFLALEKILFQRKK